MAEKKKNVVTREAAEAAVRTLLQWAGDDPDGLPEALHTWFGEPS